MCLHAIANAPGASIDTHVCGSPLAPEDVWTFDGATGLLRHPASGLCLDAGTPFNASCWQAPLNSLPYCNPLLDPVARATDFAGRLSLAEKVTNLQNDNPGVPRLGVPPLQVCAGCICPPSPSPLSACRPALPGVILHCAVHGGAARRRDRLRCVVGRLDRCAEEGGGRAPAATTVCCVVAPQGAPRASRTRRCSPPRSTSRSGAQ